MRSPLVPERVCPRDWIYFKSYLPSLNRFWYSTIQVEICKRVWSLLTCIASKVLAKTLQDNKSIHAAILDFNKAFDKVPHPRLLCKLEYYGIRENLLKWLESFLIGRTQSVICDGSRSNPIMVTSRVPQGTVLGPPLYYM